MKLNIKLLVLTILALSLALLVCACAPVDPPPAPPCDECVDADSDGVCDACGGEVDLPDVPPVDKLPDVSGISLPSKTVTYDGKAHSLEFVGTMPEGVYHIFEGNNKTTVGTYTVNLKFYYAKDGDLSEIPDSMLTATLEIKKASYDMSGISVADKTVTYNGEKHSVELSGLNTLPTGVTYSVEGDKKSDVGTYPVTVTFTGDSKNYEPIAPLTAELKILPATLGGISFSGATFTYDGQPKSLRVVGAPDFVKVSYSVENVTDVGVYPVVVSFDAGDNYHELPDLEAELIILPADIDTTGVVVKGTEAVYDGQPKSLVLENVPDTLTYSLSLENLVLPGEYEIVITFTPVDTKNYNTPDPMTARMTLSVGDYLTEGLLFREVDGGYAVVGYEGDSKLIVIPATYEGAAVVSVASNAFYGNTEIVGVYMPESVTNVGNAAFDGCTSLSRLQLGAVTVIGQMAFRNTALTEAHLPDSLLVIGFGAFEGAPLESLTIPFIGGSHNTSNAYLGFIFGAGAPGVNNQYVPTTLKTVVISDAAGEIPAYAFYGLSSIEKVSIGRTVKSIGISAFAGCSGISDLYIPSSVKKIEANSTHSASPFYGCADELMLVFESGSGFGKYYAHISEDKTALTIYGKSYEDYLVNKDSYRVADLTDATLAGILLDGALIEGFSPDKTDYTITVDINKGYGLFAVIASSNAARVEKLEQPSSANGHKLTAIVVSGDENTTVTYTVTIEIVGSFNATAGVTNKDGTKGTVTYVIDDGYKPTAEYVKSKLEEVSNLAISFAISTKNFVTLLTEVGEDGIERYVKDEDGNYVYSISDTQQQTIDFWRDILAISRGRSEIVSHTHTHAPWGYNDLGGTYIYTHNGSAVIKTAPEDAIHKEIYGSKQIILDIFGEDGCMGLAMVTAGINQSGGDVTLKADFTKTVTNAVVRLNEDAAVKVTDGVITLVDETKILLNPVEITVTAGTAVTTATEVVDGKLPKGTVITVASLPVYLPSGTVIPGYQANYYGMHEDGIENGDLVGSRLTGKVVYTYKDFADIENRMRLKGYMIVTDPASDAEKNEANNDPSLADPWIEHIDNALAKGGIASFCIHAIVDDVNNFSGEGGHAISKAQADRLFGYTESLGDQVWVATLTDAMLYYYEWSTAVVTSSYEDGKISVSLTDSERDDVYTMPLTVKVTVPGLWNTVSDGENLYEVKTSQDGTRYVLVNMAPETSITLVGA